MQRKIRVSLALSFEVGSELTITADRREGVTQIDEVGEGQQIGEALWDTLPATTLLTLFNLIKKRLDDMVTFV